MKRNKTVAIVVSAFLSGKKRKRGPTRTDGNVLYYYNSPIARRYPDVAGLIIDTHGYGGHPSTRERLNALPGVSVNVRRHQLHLNGEPWDGRERFVPSNPGDANP
jgi:hypothetical protein